MCLILIGTAHDIKKLKLKNAWQFNHDGAGIIIPGKTPTIFKGVMKFNSLINILSHIDDSLEIAVHLRAATHGSATPDNTHPFHVRDSTYLMHNGILSNLGSPGHTGRSDSAHLAQILSRVAQRDILPLLNSLQGKYALINGKSIFTVGMFETFQNVTVSNTYWTNLNYTGRITPISTPISKFYSNSVPKSITSKLGFDFQAPVEAEGDINPEIIESDRSLTTEIPQETWDLINSGTLAPTGISGNHFPKSTKWDDE